jgi:large subunit ribosomal protein L23
MSIPLTARDILIAPVVSEKSYSLIEANKYSFKVHPKAHKTQIRQAVEELFDVKVVSVNVVKVQPKPKRRGLHRGTKPGWKKAIVRLREGDTIEIFEGAGVV